MYASDHMRFWPGAKRLMMNQFDSDTPRASVGPRRRSRAPLAVTLGLILVVGSLVGWGVAKFLIFQNDQGTNIALPKTGELPKKAEKTPDPTPLNAVQPLPSPVPVDSYAADAAYDITQWTKGDEFSGYIDAASVNGVALPKGGLPRFAPGDVIVLSGWTGEVNVGIRLPYVMASVCDKVVGHAPVSGHRPDVAKAVHPNLIASGWRMRIALASLPNCEDRSLRVWGVVPGQARLILPLNGHVPMAAPDSGPGPATNPGKNKTPEFQNSQPLMTQDITPLKSLTLMVKADTLNIRACGDATCSITGKFRKGEWTVVKMDESKDWLLVATPERAGWVARRFVQIGG